MIGTHPQPFTLRLALPADMDAMSPLMERAIRELQAPFLPPDAVSASFEIMGIDTQLVEDGTYFVAEAAGDVVGCGGWSRRKTLYGGDHTGGRDAAILDPATDAARIRAMYTHPGHTRRGIGRAILEACEGAAHSEGFSRFELMATLAGEPLYRTCGYEVIEETSATTSGGVVIPLRLMGRSVTGG